MKTVVPTMIRPSTEPIHQDRVFGLRLRKGRIRKPARA
jgi:hypothetical protein